MKLYWFILAILIFALGFHTGAWFFTPEASQHVSETKPYSYKAEVEEIPIMKLRFEVTEIDGEIYRALPPLEDRKPNEEPIGLEFRQDQVWANEHLKIGQQIIAVFNDNTGELIYIESSK